MKSAGNIIGIEEEEKKKLFCTKDKIPGASEGKVYTQGQW